MKNIVICGGHLSPALAIIEALSKNKDYKVFYFGRKKALEGDSGESLEHITIKKLGIPFKSLITGRLQRTFTIYTIPSLFKIPLGILQSALLLLMIRPKVVVSFGGYIALPVCLVAALLQIPIITHEQTHYVGLSNNIIARVAQVLCLSYKETRGIPPRVTTVVTGNPIRDSLFMDKSKRILEFGDQRLPLIYITGGNLGSRSINQAVRKILRPLCAKYRVLHQTGNAEGEADFRHLTQLKNALPADFRKNYNLIRQIDPAYVGIVLRGTQLLIGRAGANTVSEILIFGLPSILIPLPWAGQNEQEKNAEFVKKVGLGEIIKRSQLTSVDLLDAINKIMDDLNFYKQHASSAKKLIRIDGAKNLAKLINAYCA